MKNLSILVTLCASLVLGTGCYVRATPGRATVRTTNVRVQPARRRTVRVQTRPRRAVVRTTTVRPARRTTVRTNNRNNRRRRTTTTTRTTRRRGGSATVQVRTR